MMGRQATAICAMALFVLPVSVIVPVVAMSPQASAAISVTSEAAVPGKKLETTVEDPKHPKEPWVVTTFKEPGESDEDLAKRHERLVEAVRQALNE